MSLIAFLGPHTVSLKDWSPQRTSRSGVVQILISLTVFLLLLGAVCVPSVHFEILKDRILTF